MPKKKGLGPTSLHAHVAYRISVNNYLIQRFKTQLTFYTAFHACITCSDGKKNAYTTKPLEFRDREKGSLLTPHDGNIPLTLCLHFCSANKK